MADWQPIETAPKDGVYFLAYSQGWREGAFMCSWDKRHEVWIDHCDLDPVAEGFEPGFWMPLPEPPDPVMGRPVTEQNQPLTMKK